MGSKYLDVGAIIISIISAGFTGTTLYYGQLRGPHFVASTGNYIYVQGRPRIGVPVSFFNEGARAGVINYGTLTLKDGSNTFRFGLTLLSPSADKWIDEGDKRTQVPTTLSLFSQVAVKGGDISEGVFWYSPELEDFKFRAETDYGADLIFYRRGSARADGKSKDATDEVVLSSATVRFHISKTTADNCSQNPGTPIPVPTGLVPQP
jgi:hypothetical protein